MQPDQNFWESLDALVASSRVTIDRPKGSLHPRYPGPPYPLDYGYLEGTTAGDGSGIDVWLGSRVPPVLDAVILTVDLFKRDVEIKLLLGCDETEKQTILAFLNDRQAQNLLRGELVRRQPVTGILEARRSVRRFQARPVPHQTIERLLQAAAWAPSAHNRQPWRFVVLTEMQSKQDLAKAMGAEFRRDLLADGLPVAQVEAQVERSRQRLLDAPAAILLCLDTGLEDIYPDARRQQAETLMGVQSVAMAGENLLLAACSEGLAGVWVCAPLFAPQAANQALDLPETWQAQGLLLLGYPAESPKERRLRPISEIARFR